MNPEQLRDASMLELFALEGGRAGGNPERGAAGARTRACGGHAHLESCMRAAHSLKGAARIVGLDGGVRVAHVMEDCLVAAQRGGLLLTPSHIDALLQGTDLLQRIGHPPGGALDWPERKDWPRSTPASRTSTRCSTALNWSRPPRGCRRYPQQRPRFFPRSPARPSGHGRRRPAGTHAARQRGPAGPAAGHGRRIHGGDALAAPVLRRHAAGAAPANARAPGAGRHPGPAGQCRWYRATATRRAGRSAPVA